MFVKHESIFSNFQQYVRTVKETLLAAYATYVFFQN